MADKTIILRLEVQGFGEARKDLEFLTTETKKSTEAKKDQNRESAQAAKVLNAEEGSIAKLRAQTALLRQEADKMRAVTKEEIAQRQQLSKQISENTAKINEHDRSMGNHRGNVGNYASTLKGLGTQLLGVAGLTAGLSGAVKLFQGVLFSTDKIGDDFRRTMSGLGNSMDFFMKSLATMDFSGFWEGLREANKLGRELYDILDSLQESRNAVTIRESEARIEIAKLMKEVRNETIAESERIEKAKQILKIEDELAGARIKNAQKERDGRLQNAAAMAKVSEEELVAFLRTFDLTEEIRKQGAEYNVLNAQLKILETNHGRVITQMEGVAPVVVDNTDKIAKQKAEMAKYGDQAKITGALMEGYGRLNTNVGKEVELLVKSIVNLNAEQASFDEQTARVDSRMNALIKRQDLANEKTGEGAAAKKKESETAKELANNLERLRLESFITDIDYDFMADANEKAMNKILADRQKVWDETAKGSDILTKDLIKGIKEEQKEHDEAMKQQVKDRADANKQILDAKVETVNLGFDLASTFFEREATKYEKEKERELAAAGDNAAKRAQIEAEYEKKQRAVRIKMAIADKLQGVFNIGVNTAVGITNALSKVVTIPLVPWIAAMGAIQAGIVLAKPLPFWRGGKIQGGARIRPDHTGDDTLIVAKQGEVILNERQQRKLGGAEVFKKIGVPGFAEGGVVGSPSISYSPGSGFDVDIFLSRMTKEINDKKVYLVLPELNKAQSTLDIVTNSSEL